MTLVESFVLPSFVMMFNEIKDLKVGMTLEGVVTNVTAFGCFVDVGGIKMVLVHISELSDGFVANPADVVKPSRYCYGSSYFSGWKCVGVLALV